MKRGDGFLRGHLTVGEKGERPEGREAEREKGGSLSSAKVFCVFMEQSRERENPKIGNGGYCPS